MTRFEGGKLFDFFKWFDPASQNHRDAIYLLQEEIEAIDPFLMDDTAGWCRLYRNKVGTDRPHTQRFTPLLLSQLTGYKAKYFSPEFCHDCEYLFEQTGFIHHLEASRMLMANLLHESGRLKYMREIDSGEYLNNRADLGNVFPGDGPKFRGCGPLMVTGRTHFETFYRWLIDNDSIDDPRIIEEGTDYVSKKYPFSIAICWIQNNNLLDICLNQGFDQCCYRINGGFNGYQDRLNAWHLCQQYMV